MSVNDQPVRRGLLLAGGYGSRLKPLTDKTPKCLVPIAGRPLLYYWLQALFDSESPLQRVLVNTHYLSEQVLDFVESSPWCNRVDFVHEERLLGTAGTIRYNWKYFGNEPFFVAHADNFSCFSLSEFKNRFASRPSECVGTMMTFESDRPKECGIVELDSRGVVVGYHEKVPNPPGVLANAAVFIFDVAIHGFLRDNPEAFDLCADAIPRLIGRLNTYHNSIYHRDIGTPDSYRLAVVAANSNLNQMGGWTGL